MGTKQEGMGERPEPAGPQKKMTTEPLSREKKPTFPKTSPTPDHVIISLSNTLFFEVLKF